MNKQERNAAYYQANKERIRERRRGYKVPRSSWKLVRRRRSMLRAFKQFIGCERCGWKEDAYALELHHTDPTAKEKAVSHLIGRTFDRAWTEIEKCQVLCCNCHAIITRRRLCDTATN